MTKPNFFIIGAPKCGTTSWATWLGQHPQVFFCPVKEPYHFNTDQNHVLTPDRGEYEKLFSGVTSRHRAVGEGSPWYFLSKEAVPNIETYTQGTARYIVCLRNPIEMAPSLHAELYFTRHEQVKNFAEAWHMSDARMRGESMMSSGTDPRLLAYKSVCLLGEQIERLYRNVPRDRVHTILLDDVKLDTRATYLSALEFLNLEDDLRTEFIRENPAKTFRLRLFADLPNRLQQIKDMLRIKTNLGIGESISRANTKITPWESLSNDMRLTLENHFYLDILLLQDLLKRDLSAWSAHRKLHSGNKAVTAT